MKKSDPYIWFLLVWTMFTIDPVNAQTFYWSNQIGSNAADYGRSGTCDKDGNTYFAGGFDGDSCYFQTDTLLRHGINDLFLVKYDQFGKEQWVRQIGGWNWYSDESCSVYYDNVSNHIFISGSYYGAGSFGSCVLTSAGGLDIFLLKYDLDGNCIWGTKAGGAGDDEPLRLAFDRTGKIFMCGTVSLSATFDDKTIPRGGFLAKFDQNGKCLWAKKKFEWWPTFNSKIRCGGLKCWDSDIIVGGCMSLDDTITIDTILISHKGFGSSLICCFDSTGTAKWLKEGISAATETISDISIDSMGNIFHAGYFVDSINFSGHILSSLSADKEMFLVKYNKTGNFKWARQTYGNSFAEGYNIATNVNGNIIAVGVFGGSVQFGSFHIQSLSSQDMFITGYDSLGNCLGAYNYGNGKGSGIWHDPVGNLYFTFLFNDATSLGIKSFKSQGGQDVLLTKCSAITGIGEPKSLAQNTLIIYANPNTGKCNITLPEEFFSEPRLSLQIYDNLGKLIQQAPVEQTDGTIKLNIEAQAKGVYTAVLGNGRKRYTGKIIFR